MSSSRSGRAQLESVAGVELASDRVRVAVGHREEARLRVTGLGHAAVRSGAIDGGLVVHREAVAVALASAFRLAERAVRASRVVAAIDGDDVRTYHLSTTFEREALDAPMVHGEVARAIAEARAAAEQAAREAVQNDAALRGVATVPLRDDLAGLTLDGRPLASLEGFQGRYVEVRTDLALAPLVLASAAMAALEGARRKGTITSGAYALGRLIAGPAASDAGILRLGPDVTSVAILREGRIAATRAFGLGRQALQSRIASIEQDAAVWARCVTAPLAGMEAPPPARWHLLGVPEDLLALPRALGDAVTALRGGDSEVQPLRPSLAPRAFSTEPLGADDLVCVAAAALAAQVS